MTRADKIKQVIEVTEKQLREARNKYSRFDYEKMSMVEFTERQTLKSELKILNLLLELE